MYFALSIITCIILLSCAAEKNDSVKNASTALSDVAGWENVAWGMKKEDILQKYPQAIKSEKSSRLRLNTYEALAITDFVQGKDHFRVTFFMHNATHGVSEIFVDYYGGEHLEAYERIEERLISDYGKPTREISQFGEILKGLRWFLPKTNILLAYMRGLGINEQDLIIHFSQPVL